jgi:hypothetical protein
MSGVTHSKSTFVVHDLPAFTAAVKSGAAILAVEPHETRSKKMVYYVKATINEQSHRLYIALPKGSNLEIVPGEKVQLALKIDVVNGKPVDSTFESFETTYRAFMKETIEPLLKPIANTSSELRLANFSKAEGSTSKFTLLQLPRGIKPDQITRLQEAKGSHILISISYMYIMDDAEKGVAYYGSIFEAGRYPFTPSNDKPAAKKRKTEDDESKLGGGIAVE